MNACPISFPFERLLVALSKVELTYSFNFPFNVKMF